MVDRKHEKRTVESKYDGEVQGPIQGSKQQITLERTYLYEIGQYVRDILLVTREIPLQE